MRIVAGVDVGNATTEVVLVDASVDPPRPLVWDRCPTRGVKGSAAAARGAAALVRRLEARSGGRAVRVLLAPQRPVTMRAEVRADEPVPDGPLRLVAAGAATPGRPGLGAGRPVPLTAAVVHDEPVVLLAPAGTGHRDVVDRVRAWLDDGADVRAVVLADDEGVLVAHRLPQLAAALPILDGVDVAGLATTLAVVVEVAEPGRAVQAVADPLHLLRLLGRSHDEAARRAAAGVARRVADQPNAVVALLPATPQSHSVSEPALEPELDSESEPSSDEAHTGTVTAGVDRPSSDWTVDLAAVAESVELRRDPTRRLPMLSARLGDPDPADGDVAAATLRQVLAGADRGGPEVVIAASEGAAARAGALSTPGARSDGLVLDLGGGTLDAVTGDVQITVAGGGDLVTLAVAELLQVPGGAAEWAKRGPCERVESPHTVLGEDGARRFVDRALPPATVGSLVVTGPAGLLPFTRTLAPAEWRALRLRVKREVLGRNISRCLDAVDGRDVLLVGGVAGDGELLRILDLPRLVGRADVAGTLGHRWAVAYGLTLLDVDSSR